jgi:uncharacterized membrane protein YkvA (DUF1232 family)
MTALRAWLGAWKQQAQRLKLETYALYRACRDPRVPWYAKLVAGGVLAYLFSPIDLIPDFIPVIGFLDDLIVVPLGIALVLKLIPPQVMVECRAQASLEHARPTNWAAAIIIVLVWLLLAGLGIALVVRAFQKGA